MLEANYTEAVQEDFYQIEISKDEKEDIIELSKDPAIYEKLISSMVPSIYGYEKIKEALLLQLLGGVHKKRTDGSTSRGDIHMLLVGDPGSGKSAMLKRVSSIAPKGRYVAGKGSTGAGLTAAVVKDEFLGGWSLEAGALVLSNNGVVAIDEMDKMGEEDRAAMHEALEQQSVSIAKANIQATLSAKTTVLAAANPKFGRFDPHGIIAEQIDMPPTLINRFDLIFPIKDLPDTSNDEKLARHILRLHQNADISESEVPTQLLKKYIAYARQTSFPVIIESAFNEIKDFYVQMRNREVVDEKASRSIPISARQLEALVRLAEAHAKVRLSKEVTRKDARKAIELLTYCLLQVGLDRETGLIDIDRISTGIICLAPDQNQRSEGHNSGPGSPDRKKHSPERNSENCAGERVDILGSRGNNRKTQAFRRHLRAKIRATGKGLNHKTTSVLLATVEICCQQETAKGMS